jgi:IS30 family transposase
MPKSYKHLTQLERCQIHALKSTGMSQRAMAKQLSVHHSSISRELSRNTGKKGYRYKQAQQMADEQQQKAHARPRVMTPNNIMIIEGYLEKKWSPEQIAGRLKKEGILRVSHESIYQHIYKERRKGGSLYKHLRHKGKKYNRRSKGTAGRGCIPNRVDISERPKRVESKSRYGDWEGDLVIGVKHQGALLTHVERRSKFTLIGKLDGKDSLGVLNETLGRFNTIQRFIKTITYDNGKEFARHQELSKCLDTGVYFARPYHSWERGLNEHTNGLIRQYFPKSTNFLLISEDEIRAVEKALNDRPRKVLNYRTPREVFTKLLSPEERVALAA